MYELYDTVTKESVLSRTSPEQIFIHYGFNPATNRNFKSPFRNDPSPSCAFHNSSANGLCVKDFGGDGFYGDCFAFVGKLHNISYNQAIEKIAQDLGIAVLPERQEIPRVFTFAQESEKIYKEFTVVAKPFTNDEYAYWASYGITVNELKKFKVFSVKELWINNKRVYSYRSKDDPAFAYMFEEGKFKVYFPLRAKSSGLPRFYSNYRELQGLKLLPESGRFLCLTKSYKDVMLFSRFGVPAVAAASESSIIDSVTMADLKSRFPFIASLYDFDYSGIVGANRLKKEHKIPAYFLTNGRFGSTDFKAKDLTDYYKTVGYDRISLIINTFKQCI
jgi:hypothetical protein